MHIGFIMDGNRRWATARNILKKYGHSEGVNALDNVLELCVRENIEYVSFWALAKKNIEERSEDELSHIYTLLKKEIVRLTPKMIENNVRFETIGNIDLLPADVQEALNTARAATASSTKHTCILAIAYGGQDEIVRAIKQFVQAGGDIDTLDEHSFLTYLDTGRFPSPDLIVRTGGDTRHSGYFLYQAEYSEYYFTDTLWPDFSEEEFYKALKTFRSAKRNFGK